MSKYLHTQRSIPIKPPTTTITNRSRIDLEAELNSVDTILHRIASEDLILGQRDHEERTNAWHEVNDIKDRWEWLRESIELYAGKKVSGDPFRELRGDAQGLECELRRSEEKADVEVVGEGGDAGAGGGGGGK